MLKFPMALTKQDLTAIDKLLTGRLNETQKSFSQLLDIRLKDQDKRFDEKLLGQDSRFDKKLSDQDKRFDEKLLGQDSRFDKKLSDQDKRFDEKLISLRKQIHGDIATTLSIGLAAVDKRIDKLEKQIQN
ncbi:MAG: hypothetical protein G01um10145_854 [Microgenomates group bacterium Gr01-1014_5]|nr:MAG: hypothetical protein G01um10145_854 [Microgenomates group bacterium Gr01-1014_5]